MHITSYISHEQIHDAITFDSDKVSLALDLLGDIDDDDVDTTVEEKICLLRRILKKYRRKLKVEKR